MGTATDNGNRGIVGEPAYLDHSILTLPMFTAGESEFGLTFKYNDTEGVPGAIIVKNHHLDEFYLKSITIENFPGKGRIHFVCNSWVYNVSKYTYDRIFFANNVSIKLRFVYSFRFFKYRFLTIRLI